MKIKKIIWREKKGLGPLVLLGYIGKLQVFSTGWSIMTKDEEELPYRLHCNFTGLHQTRFKTQEDAMSYAQKSIEEIIRELIEE